MTGDEYLTSVLQKTAAPVGTSGPGNTVRNGLLPLISRWGGTQLASVQLSGSYAKATAIVGGTDVDLLLSLKSNTTGTLKDLYESLASFLTSNGYSVRRQNVSIGITYRGYAVDLVPARRQDDWFTQNHNIYVRRLDSWTKTNVQTHINYVTQSHRRNVILLMKRWRQCHNLSFLSFALELAVIKALSGKLQFGLSQQLTTVLGFLRNSIVTTQLIDPANTNNNVADDLSNAEKRLIATLAAQGIAAQYWSGVVW